MSPNTRRLATMLGALLMAPGGGLTPVIAAPLGDTAQSAHASATATPSLVLSETLILKQTGGRNPTVAVDQKSGAVYMAWAQEAPSSEPAQKKGKKADPKLEVLLARSDDGGRHFGIPVVVNSPKDRVISHSVNPTQVGVGPKGEVYVLYGSKDPDFTLEGSYLGRALLRLARSEDGGRSFAAPIEIGSEAAEGVVTSLGMANLFVAPDGSLYVSWLDSRESIAYVLKHKKHPPRGVYASQLRVARSIDAGRSFAKSTLVTKPVCVCCGTKVAQGVDGPLYASTRGSAFTELKGSVDAVRDIIVAASHDHGATWSKAVKVHDDRFKISGCPDITPGLSVDSKGRLHAAWYTGTELHPGVFYAVSSNGGKSFSEPIALLTDEWVPYGDVKLALDAHDNAWVAFEDRRGDIDLIHLARVTTDGQVTRAQPWPGTIPDVAGLGDSVVVAWGALVPEGEKQGGGIQTLIASPKMD